MFLFPRHNWIFKWLSFSVNELHVAIHRICFQFILWKTIKFLGRTNARHPQFFLCPNKNQLDGTEFYDCRLPAATSDFKRTVPFGCSTTVQPFISISSAIRFSMPIGLATQWQIYAAFAPAWHSASGVCMEIESERVREQLPMGKIIFSDKWIICILLLRTARRQMFFIRLDPHQPYLNGMEARGIFFHIIIAECDRNWYL